MFNKQQMNPKMIVLSYYVFLSKNIKPRLVYKNTAKYTQVLIYSDHTFNINKLIVDVDYS